MTLRELLERERDRAADIQCVMPWGTHDEDDYRKYWFEEGANHFIGLLWPCIKVLEEIAEGQAGTQSKGAQKAKSALEKLKNR